MADVLGFLETGTGGMESGRYGGVLGVGGRQSI